MDHDAERRILAQIAAIKQEHAEKHGEQNEQARRLDALYRAVHDEYAGAEGIGPTAVGNKREINAMKESAWSAGIRAWFSGVKGIGGWAVPISALAILALGAYGCREQIDTALNILDRQTAAEEGQSEALEDAADALEEIADEDEPRALSPATPEAGTPEASGDEDPATVEPASGEPASGDAP